jgi:hypothetical protein
MEYLFLASAVFAFLTAGWLRFTHKRREFNDEVNPELYSDEYIKEMTARVEAWRAQSA